MSSPAANDLLASARELSELARTHADDGEKRGQLHPGLVAALKSAGLFGMLVPRELGGLEVDVATFVAAIEAVARGDGAAGWCVMIAATTGVTAAQLPREGAEEIFADPFAPTAGVLMPKGRATRAEGGWQVNGTWAFGSGTGHAKWILGGATVYGPDGPELAEGKAPHARMMFFPRDDVSIRDTWHVSGLRGTGSNDFEVADVSVPDRRSATIGGGTFWTHGPTYAFPIYGLLALGVAATGLGIARAAIETLRDLATAKTPTGSRRLLSERAAAQSGIAEAEGLVRSASAFMREAVAEAWQRAAAGSKMGLHERAALRLAATTAALWSARAVDLCYNLGGASSIYESNLLQRQFRDVHTMTQHVMVGQPTLEVAGRIMLGIPTDTSMF
jgi:alkylation response protein AidB-like acyl-CoA dehydrogenase